VAGRSEVVLISGCSSGIGRATAERLARAGQTVYATARDEATLEPLRAAGCNTLALDVCSEDSMREAVERVTGEHGAVGVLVNNAGYSQSGALETLTTDSVRRQFETNVFGLLRLTQLVLPGMRRAGGGRIVNIGSMGGKLTFPGGGIYHATKYAVEALSDALRFEVRGFGVRVVLIEPGLIRTEFARTAVASVDAAADATVDAGVYERFNRAVRSSTSGVYEGPLGALGGGPETVAEAIRRALTVRRPRARYSVTPSAKVALLQRRLSPDAVWDLLLRSQFPVPGA
jgi:NADP-dependent 3-hydroxy acid dehydrogenase YdfG